MFIKLLLSHIVISLIVGLTVLFAMGTPFGDITCYVAFLFVLLLYFYSGYLSTISKANWYNYFAIAAISLLFFIICYFNSPGLTNHRNVAVEELYNFYELYMLASLPLRFSTAFASFGSFNSDLFLKLLLSLLFSCSQFAGGLLKAKQLQ